MQQLIKQIATIRFSRRTVPLALLGISVISFGLLVPGLGFFQDDWPILYFQATEGAAGLWKLHLYQIRPLGAGVYTAAFALLGNQVVLWHAASLGVRILTVWLSWRALLLLWPGQERLLTWAALLFAIYPLFLLQPLSVTYLIHWVGFAVFFGFALVPCQERNEKSTFSRVKKASD